MQKFSRKSVLILEDEAIVALDLDEIVTEAGFCVASIISSCADAIEWLKNHTPDVAILDVELRDGPCIEVARIIADKSVPFVVFSGNVPLPSTDPVFLKGRWLEKPAASYEVVSALRAVSDNNTYADNVQRLSVRP